MEILWLGADSFERHETGNLEQVLARPDGFLWIDIPYCDESTAQFLGKMFGFHQLALRDCLEPTHVPKVYGYSDHVYLALHVPEPGAPGVVHVLELDHARPTSAAARRSRASG